MVPISCSQVAVVEGHRQRAAKREAERAAQQHGAQQAGQAERLGLRLLNPWRVWRSSSRSLTPTEQVETELGLAHGGVSQHQQQPLALPQHAQHTLGQTAWQVGAEIVPPEQPAGYHQPKLPQGGFHGLAAAQDLSGAPAPAPGGQTQELVEPTAAALIAQTLPSLAAAEGQTGGNSSSGSAPAVIARYTEGGGASLRNRQNGGSSSDSGGTPNSNLQASLLP